MAKIVRYSMTFLGEVEIDDELVNDDAAIVDEIRRDYYDKGFDAYAANDIEYEVEEI